MSILKDSKALKECLSNFDCDVFAPGLILESPPAWMNIRRHMDNKDADREKEYELKEEGKRIKRSDAVAEGRSFLEWLCNEYNYSSAMFCIVGEENRKITGFCHYSKDEGKRDPGNKMKPMENSIEVLSEITNRDIFESYQVEEKEDILSYCLRVRRILMIDPLNHNDYYHRYLHQWTRDRFFKNKPVLIVYIPVFKSPWEKLGVLHLEFQTEKWFRGRKEGEDSDFQFEELWNQSSIYIQKLVAELIPSKTFNYDTREQLLKDFLLKILLDESPKIFRASRVQAFRLFDNEVVLEAEASDPNMEVKDTGQIKKLLKEKMETWELQKDFEPIKVLNHPDFTKIQESSQKHTKTDDDSDIPHYFLPIWLRRDKETITTFLSLGMRRPAKEDNGIHKINADALYWNYLILQYLKTFQVLASQVLDSFHRVQKKKRHNKLIEEISKIISDSQDIISGPLTEIARLITRGLRCESVSVFFRLKVDLSLQRYACFINDRGDFQNNELLDDDKEWSSRKKKGLIKYWFDSDNREIGTINYDKKQIENDKKINLEVANRFRSLLPSGDLSYLLMTPITLGDKNVGAIRALNHSTLSMDRSIVSRIRFDKDDEDLMQTIANLLAIGFSIYRKKQKFEVINHLQRSVEAQIKNSETGIISLQTVMRICLKELASHVTGFSVAQLWEYQDDGSARMYRSHDHDKESISMYSSVLEKGETILNWDSGSNECNKIIDKDFKNYKWAEDRELKAVFARNLSISGMRLCILVFWKERSIFDDQAKSLIYSITDSMVSEINKLLNHSYLRDSTIFDKSSFLSLDKFEKEYLCVALNIYPDSDEAASLLDRSRRQIDRYKEDPLITKIENPVLKFDRVEPLDKAKSRYVQAVIDIIPDLDKALEILDLNDRQFYYLKNKYKIWI